MSIGHLVLRAGPEGQVPTLDAAIETLEEIGLIGAPYRKEENRFLAGDRFLQLITFLGCSPYLQLEPPPGGGNNFCHVHLLGPSERPGFIYGSNTRPPRCPDCGQPFTEWRTTVEHYRKCEDTSPICTGCGRRQNPMVWNWRRYAGFSRSFIDIPEVFPGEAVPVPALITALQGDGATWDYFYVQDPTRLI
jgi:hypothetical protein